MATTNTVTSSPVALMDWESKLGQGNTDAQTRTVTDPELVKNQLTDLTSSDSKYIQQARDRANNAASSRGMLMSSVAAGGAERAAIDAALPIAQQDAASYGTAARDNQQATNTDRLADQSQWGQLVGQEVGIRANLDDAERNRAFQSNENTAQRDWQGTQNTQQQTWQSGESQLARTHDFQIAEKDQNFRAAQSELDRTFNGTQNEKQLANQRLLQFYEQINGQQGMVANVLSSIYSNPNLTAQQQAQAAANARASLDSLFQSYAKTMAQGVPEVFLSPYVIGGTSATSPAAAGGANTPTPAAPIMQQPAAPQPATGGGGSGGMTAGPGATPPAQAPWRDLARIAER